MTVEERDYLTGKLIDHLKKDNCDWFRMFHRGINYLSGYASDLPVEEAVEIVTAAVDYIEEHRSEI